MTSCESCSARSRAGVCTPPCLLKVTAIDILEEHTYKRHRNKKNTKWDYKNTLILGFGSASEPPDRRHTPVFFVWSHVALLRVLRCCGRGFQTLAGLLGLLGLALFVALRGPYAYRKRDCRRKVFAFRREQ